MPRECKKYISDVKGIYKQKLDERKDKFPTCRLKELVRLELVEREKGEGYSDDFQRGKAVAKVEGYSANMQEDRKGKAVKHTPLAYDDLFKVESGKSVKILVEGDAGIGKTTLCIAVSEDWANGDLFQQFDLVLYLPLRMKAVASADSLSELLKFRDPCSTPAMHDKVVEYFQGEKQKKVLIIVDGLESKLEEGTFLYSLLFNSVMSVVVTSRPSASASLRNNLNINRFVEVRGFSEKHIEEYINSVFGSNKDKAGRLLAELKGNPPVESVCSVPFNCAIVCRLWDILEEALPTTMTELYKKIVLSFVFLESCEYDDDNTLPTEFEFLLTNTQQSLWRLCEFAFTTLEMDKLDFSQDELKAIIPEGWAPDKEEQRFGLLQQTNVVDVGKSFHFLHLTVQEFLAALHLARQNTDDQCKFFQSHKPHSSFSPYRFEMVRRFFFGINSSKFNEDMSSVIEQSLKCEDDNDNINSLSVCHCAFEASCDFIYNDVAKYLLKEDTKYLIPHRDLDIIHFGYPCTAYDCSAILHVIANMKYSGRLRVTLDHASEDQVKTLLDMKAKLKMIVDLNLDDSRLTVSILQRLKEAVVYKQLTQLTTLTLERCPISDAEAIISFVTAVKANYLNRLSFWIDYIKDSSWSSIEVQNDDIDGDRLSVVNLDDKDVANLIESLCKLNMSDNALALKHLEIMDIHAPDFIYLANAISSGKLKVTEGLHLHTYPLGLEGAISISRILSSRNCQLSSISLVNCQLTTAVGGLQNTDTLCCENVNKQLYQMARNTRSSTIIKLCLDENSFTGEGIHILAGFIYLCPNVEELSTMDCDITSDDLIQLLDKLTQLKSSLPSLCSNLREWNLANNQLDDGRGLSVLEQRLPSLFPCCYALYLPIEETMPTLEEKLEAVYLRRLEYLAKVSCFVYM